jgi:hypothetical protein
MAENLIGQVSKNVHDKIVPNPEPTKINKGLHITAKGLRSTSGVAVKASSYVGKELKCFVFFLIFFFINFSIKNWFNDTCISSNIRAKSWQS